jgi:hypothetical protein
MLLSSVNKMLVGLSFFVCTSLFATPLVIDVAGIQSNGQIGDPGNTVLNFNVGANAAITSIGYSVNVTAFTPSWLAEIGLAFTDSDGTGVSFNPGFEDQHPGTATYTGFAELAPVGLSFNVGSDGILRLEFFEDVNDLTGADGQWNFGNIVFNVEGGNVPGGDVPEPASALLIGAGLAMMGYAGRRRRTASC